MELYIKICSDYCLTSPLQLNSCGKNLCPGKLQNAYQISSLDVFLSRLYPCVLVPVFSLSLITLLPSCCLLNCFYQLDLRACYEVVLTVF